MYLLHVCPGPIDDVVDGKLYTIPSGEPTEIQADFVARAIMEHKAYSGITEVEISRTRTGIQFDIEGAKRRASVQRKAGLQRMVDNYIRTQLEDRIRKNFPAMPPSEVEQEAIEELGIDLSSYGIRPVGFSGQVRNMQPSGEQMTTQANKIAMLEEAMKALMEQNRLLMTKLDEKGGRK